MSQREGFRTDRGPGYERALDAMRERGPAIRGRAAPLDPSYLREEPAPFHTKPE